jgi:hypothetical protein
MGASCYTSDPSCKLAHRGTAEAAVEESLLTDRLGSCELTFGSLLFMHVPFKSTAHNVSCICF